MTKQALTLDQYRLLRLWVDRGVNREKHNATTDYDKRVIVAFMNQLGLSWGYEDTYESEENSNDCT